MNCSSFEVLLSDYLEGALDHDIRGRAAEHLRGCFNCACLLEEVRQIREELSLSPELELPERVVHEILDRTSGRERRAFWPVLLGRSTPSVVSSRYAFAASVLFAFVSLMVNVFGAQLSALGPSHPAALALVERAERLSGEAYRQWIWLNYLRSRTTQEIRFFQEDLLGRFDSHILTLPFQDYTDSLEELQSAGHDRVDEVDKHE